MPTERDAIEAKQSRWKRYLTQLQAEVEMAQEVIRVLEVAKGEPGLVGQMKATPPPIEKVQAASPVSRAPKNVGMTELIRAYIRDNIEEDAAISVPELTRWLQAQGMQGAYRVVYNTAAIALRKEADHKRGVGYEKGVGFFKVRREDGSKQALKVPSMTLE